VCVEFNAQLNVWGVVMVEPSTVTCMPTGFDVTVTAVGAAPYTRRIVSMSPAL